MAASHGLFFPVKHAKQVGTELCLPPSERPRFAKQNIVGYTLHGSCAGKDVQTLSYVVARMQKMKADNLVGIGNHKQRRTDNHSNKDIDVERSHLNYDLVEGRTENYKRDIEKFINENKASQRATRKDDVLVNEWIISSDHFFFDELDDKETERFLMVLIKGIKSREI